MCTIRGEHFWQTHIVMIAQYPRVVQDYSTYRMVVHDSYSDYGVDPRVVQ